MDDLYRLYIDESGTHHYSNSDEVRKRYLCLSGVIVSASVNQEVLIPRWEELRSVFTADADYPASFHYVDIVCGNGEFNILNNEEIRAGFNSKYLSLLGECDYSLCCIVLDKKLTWNVMEIQQCIHIITV